MINLNKRLAKFSFYWEYDAEFHRMIHACLYFPSLNYFYVPDGDKLSVRKTDLQKLNQKYSDLQISSFELIFILYGLFFNQPKTISQKGTLTSSEVRACNYTGLNLGLQGMLLELRKRKLEVDFSSQNKVYDGYKGVKFDKFIANNGTLLWNIGFRNYNELFAYYLGLRGVTGKNSEISTHRQRILNLTGYDIFRMER
jgi:hypothetical protein